MIFNLLKTMLAFLLFAMPVSSLLASVEDTIREQERQAQALLDDIKRMSEERKVFLTKQCNTDKPTEKDTSKC